MLETISQTKRCRFSAWVLCFVSHHVDFPWPVQPTPRGGELWESSPSAMLYRLETSLAYVYMVDKLGPKLTRHRFSALQRMKSRS